ncbi:hypothetical protein FACS189411_07540 [Bacteroidia bacterium]|nr:hypothetical protein FACS189411_07540 [Bacteroidia bacterium]
MKQITKLNEPHSLTEHRAQPYSTFDNLPLSAKQDLRENLLNEQGYICCYCTKRIPEKIDADGNISDDMKIEHYQCQTQHPELQLSYSNLLGACMGNKGKPQNLQTCDTRKGNNTTLTISPLNIQNCESLFKYSANGEISSVNNDTEINRQLKEVLNLNMQTLKDNRKQVYLEVQRRVEIASQGKSKNLKKRYFEQERNKWLNKIDGKYKEFCMVAVYYLNKKIRQNG